MAFTTAEIKEKLKALRLEKADIERKIAGLETYLGQDTTNSKNTASGGVSARSVDLDIRPTVRAILEENGNEPIKRSELAAMVAARHPGFDQAVIESKMINVQRKDLEQVGYANYRLKSYNPPLRVVEADTDF